MTTKPQHYSGYDSQHTQLVRDTCLYLATRLGDLADELIVVGGMVPGLIISQDDLPDGVSPHCGTADVDLGLAVALFEDKRYQNLTERLRGAGFEQDINPKGRKTSHRWRLVENKAMTLDFLVGPSNEEERKRRGKLRNIESDFAAIIVPGLHLAFVDREFVSLTGETIRGELASRSIAVCGPAAFIVLKALAFSDRGENKDAFDLFYVLKGYGAGVGDIVDRFALFRDDFDVDQALTVISRDFTHENATGPRRVSDFIHARPDDETLLDVAGYAQKLLVQLEFRN